MRLSVYGVVKGSRLGGALHLAYRRAMDGKLRPMKLWTMAALGAALLSGCVSTSMKTFVGRPIQDVQIEYGAPEQVIDMPDASRAYQFRTEGGAMIMPGSAMTHAYPAGGGFIATTTGMPGGVVNVPGCPLTFIARERAGVWVVEDIRVPKRLVC